jgi:hypothetical protein
MGTPLPWLPMIIFVNATDILLPGGLFYILSASAFSVGQSHRHYPISDCR